MSANLSPEKLAAILADYYAGMPMAELVAKHGCDKGTPARMARRMGGQVRKTHHPHGDWTPERDDRLRTLWDSGLSGSKIGVRLGATKNAVIGRAHRLKLSPRWTRRPNGERKAKAPPKLQEPLPVIELPALPRMPRRLLLWDLTPRDCKFPIGGAGESSVTVKISGCGPRAPGSTTGSPSRRVNATCAASSRCRPRKARTP